MSEIAWLRFVKNPYPLWSVRGCQRTCLFGSEKRAVFRSALPGTPPRRGCLLQKPDDQGQQKHHTQH